MEDIFVTGIKINDVLNIKDFEIPLSENERKHLIITGKNGSGKTSVLNDLRRYLRNIENSNISTIIDQKNRLNSQLKRKEELLLNPKTNEQQIIATNDNILNIQKWLKNLFLGTEINFNDSQSLYKNIIEKFQIGEYILAFFEAKRNITLKAPTGIQKINIKPFYSIQDKAGIDFIQYIVNLRADRSFARDENELDDVKKIDEWFDVFEEKILDIFDVKNAKLQFARRSYNFNIIEPGKPAYNLSQLSDGYSAILDIVTDLIMRMEEHKTKSYDVQGIVLIDEIETHLHIELQKKILPFLISFFPKIQFIVTTHSPFVISSIENAIICDLEKKIVTTDLSGYSYEAIVESYFDSDKYSTILKQRIEEYETLMPKDQMSESEKNRLDELKEYLDKIPKIFSDELVVKLQQIKLRNLNKKVHP